MLTHKPVPGPDRNNDDGQPARPKIRYALAVWGERYIDRFWDEVFPTHIAPNNLPFLAAMAEVRFVILTRRDDRHVFERHPMFERMRSLGPVDFVAIDDLISHHTLYAVTLTLAFTRALRSAGPDGQGDCFVFMNADFLLADGTLATVGRRLAAGASAVLAVTPRAVSESVAEILQAMPREPDGALVLSPQRMVDLMLRAPHCMVTAKQPDVTLLHSTVPNQFFWFVDRYTLLARSYLVFMLALRPRTTDYRATSFCDYSLVSDLADTDALSLITHSDDGFILELQNRRQEVETVRLGALPSKTAARYLGEWTTPFHRWTARHDFVFSSGGSSVHLEVTKARAALFIEALDLQLPAAIEGRAHPYWVAGVRAWQSHRSDPSWPAELSAAALRTDMDDQSQPPREMIERQPSRMTLPVSYRVMRTLAAPLRPLLRQPPELCDCRQLKLQLDRIAAPGAVYVYGTPSFNLKPVVGRRAVHRYALARVAERMARPAPGLTLICLDDATLSNLAVFLHHVRLCLAAGRAAIVVVERRSADPIAFHLAFAEALAETDDAPLNEGVTVILENDELVRCETDLAERIVRWQASPSVATISGAVRATLALTRLHLKLKLAPYWPGTAAAWPGVAVVFAAREGVRRGADTALELPACVA